MINTNVLFLGNGFEINFNDNLNNFNIKFKDWIIESVNKKGEFIKNDFLISRIQNFITFHKLRDFLWNNEWYYDDPLLVVKRAFSLLREKFNDLNYDIENVSIENIFKLLADDIYKNNESNLKKKTSFLDLIRSIYGIYLISLFLGYKKFTNYDLDTLENEKSPEFIFTTNYTKKINEFARLWNTKYQNKAQDRNLKDFFVSDIVSKVIHIHGKIDDDTIEKFNNPNIPFIVEEFKDLKLNLNDKFSSNFFSCLEEYEKNSFSNVTFEFFGIDIHKEKHILLSLFDYCLENSKKKFNIKYNWFNQYEIKELINSINSFGKIENPKILGNENIFSCSYLEQEKCILLKIDESQEIRDLLSAHNFEVSIKLEFLDVRNHFLYKIFNK